MLVQLDDFFHKKGQRELQNTDRPHMYTTPTTHRPIRWAFLLGSTHLEYPPLASSDEHSKETLQGARDLEIYPGVMKI